MSKIYGAAETASSAAPTILREAEVRGQLLDRCEEFMARMGISISDLSQRITGDTAFLSRVQGGNNFTIERFDAVMKWLSENWHSPQILLQRIEKFEKRTGMATAEVVWAATRSRKALERLRNSTIPTEQFEKVVAWLQENWANRDLIKKDHGRARATAAR